MKRNVKVEQALWVVELEAKEDAQYHRAQIGQKPLMGWSQEKHDAYHLENAEKAESTAKWCFIRQMQYNPD